MLEPELTTGILPVSLIGMPGSGKSTVGKEVAHRLGLAFADCDKAIEHRAGCSIAALFEREGEGAFRDLESQVLASLVAQGPSVIATGGGIVLRPGNRELLRTRTRCVYLRAGPDLLWKRVRRDRRRPLLQVDDPQRRLREMSAEREPLYEETAHLLIDSEGLLFRTPRRRGDGASSLGRAGMSRGPAATLAVQLGERSYSIHVGSGLLGSPSSYRDLPRGSSAVIVTNDTVAALYANSLSTALATIYPKRGRGRAARWRGVQDVADAADDLRRPHPLPTPIVGTTVFALGGGVIGDLAGFAAACYMRGVGYVQVPTTLLAQVDSSVGGKTGINHTAGKNLIGAFYQPLAVIADIDVLATLPRRELVAGLAEVIKYGAIADDAFLDWIEASLPALLAGDKDALAHAVTRSCEIKAAVVASDERESGLRAILNFGHTFAHAIETGTGHGTWLHGEAVGCGMAMAADLSARLGLIAPAHAMRVARVVAAAGLPLRAPSLGVARYLELDADGQEGRSGQDPIHRPRGAGQGRRPGGRRRSPRGDDRRVQRRSFHSVVRFCDRGTVSGAVRLAIPPVRRLGPPARFAVFLHLVAWQRTAMTRSRGFTLIELMITLAIVAILAAIAIPSYAEYVRRARITEAFATLSGMRVKMEQYFQDNRTYAGACGAAPSVAPLPAPTLNFTFDCPALGANNYTLRARGIAGTTVDGFTYTVDDQNARTTVMVAPSNWPSNGGCWVAKRDGSC